MLRKLLPLAFALALLGCRSTDVSPAPSLAAKPGWGRLSSPESAKLSVRAVPASARPSLPPTRFGKPGWGR